MILIAFIVNVTGTLLKGISNIAGDRREIYTLYPAIIDVIGDAGLVVSSAVNHETYTRNTFTDVFINKTPRQKHFQRLDIFTYLFCCIRSSFLMINSIFAFDSIMNLLTLLVIANIIAFAANVIISYGISILSFKRRIRPRQF
jgi:cation transporter-like permease